MRKSLLFPLLAGLAALGAVPAAAERPTEPAAQPAIWLLSDEDTRIWLFGTVHVIPPALDWRSTALDAIIESVDELVLETGNAAGVLEKPELMSRLMLRETPLPVVDRIAPEYRNRYRLMMKDLGMQAGDFDELETWAVSLMLIVLGNVGYAGELPAGEMPSGVEIELSALFDDRGKPISGVETQLDQLGVFRNLSPAGQLALLESMLEEADSEAAPEAAGTLDNWLTGDIASLDSECDAFEDLPPEAFRRLVTDRNRAWTEWLAERMDRPGDILFAVGACHLAGRSSLQTMLEARGLAAERVH